MDVSNDNCVEKHIFEKIGLLIDDDNFTILRKTFSQRRIGRDGYFLSVGNSSTELAIVTKGIFRSYYIDVNGNDITKYFYAESSILFSYKAYIRQESTMYNIQALENSEILVATISEFENVVRLNEQLLSFYKRSIDDILVQKEEHASSFKLLTNSERYELFVKQNPGLVQRVKQHQIASYLGITPVSLSRIKNKCSINK